MTVDPRPAEGLQTSIWNNNLKSIALLAVYPLILAAVVIMAVTIFGYFTGHALGYNAYGMASTWSAALSYALFVTENYWPALMTVVVLWFLISYFFQGAMIRALSHSHVVTRMDEPDLYNLVENMCIAHGMKMPRLEIIETDARNAFASGVGEDTFGITVTRGLMQSLQKDELEAVLAHELTHIINRDVRLMMVCVVFTGMLGLSAQLIWSNLRFGMYAGNRDGRRGGGAVLMLALLAVLGIGYLATLLARFAISRKREFMADAGAVQITKNPEAMIRALQRISGAADIAQAPADIKAMCFENARAFMGLFATHPPIQSRIEAISAYSGVRVPDREPAKPDTQNPWK